MAAATLTGNFALDCTTLFAVSFGGPIFFWLPASTEILAAAVGHRGFSPAIVGVVCAAGQCTLFSLLFLFGRRITSRWDFLKRRVNAVAAKRRSFLNRGKFAMTLGAAVGGLPPTVPLFTLAPSLQMRLMPMLAIVFIFRFIRFASCCFIGSLPSVSAAAISRTQWISALYEAVRHSAEWRSYTQPSQTRFVSPLWSNSTILNS